MLCGCGMLFVCVSFIDHFYVAHAIKTILLDGSIPWILWYDLPIVEIIISPKWLFFSSLSWRLVVICFFFHYYFEKMRKKSHKPVLAFNAYLVYRSSSLPLPVHKMPIKITKHVFVVLSSFIFIQFIFVLSIFYNILIVLTFENCKWNYKNTQSTKSLTCIQGRYSSETIWISSFFLAILVMRNCCIVSTNRQNRKFDLNNCQYSKHRSFVYFFLRFFSKT